MAQPAVSLPQDADGAWGSWQEQVFDAEDPLRSPTFDVPLEMGDWDRRRLAAGMAEVRQVMRREGLSFDEARLQLVRNRMAQVGADAFGMPLDPKAFTFDQAPGKVKGRLGAEGAAGGRAFAGRAGPARPRPTDAELPGQLLTQWALFDCLPSTASRAVKQARGSPVWLIAQAVLLIVLGLVLVLLQASGWLNDKMPGFLAQSEEPFQFEAPALADPN